MTDNEYQKFITLLTGYFPNISSWISDKSPDPKITHEGWRRTLQHCTYEECLHILNAWVEGREQPPSQFETHMTALLIRSRVMFDRDKERKKIKQVAEAETYADHKRAAQKRRSNYESLANAPGMHGVYDAYMRGLAIKKEFVDGKISKQEYDEQIARLVESVA